MYAKTIKKECTSERSRAINKLFHIGRHVRLFIARNQAIYRPIFQISVIFCCKRYGRTIFPYRISNRQKMRYRLISRPTRPIFKPEIGCSKLALEEMASSSKNTWTLTLVSYGHVNLCTRQCRSVAVPPSQKKKSVFGVTLGLCDICCSYHLMFTLLQSL